MGLVYKKRNGNRDQLICSFYLSRAEAQIDRMTKQECTSFRKGTYFINQCVKEKMLVAQLCLTLCESRDCSLPDFSVLGISQARRLEWVAIPFSRGSS